MYHVQLHFWIRGIDESVVRVWKKMEALPRFEHVFHLFSRSMRLPAGRNQIVFLDDKAPLQMQMLRQDIGPEGKIIVCCDEPCSIPADDLACVDDVWPSATLGELAEFRFRRLQERLKAEKDAWLTETYLEQTINTLPDMIWFKDLQGLSVRFSSGRAYTSRGMSITTFGASRAPSTSAATMSASRRRTMSSKRARRACLTSRS